MQIRMMMTVQYRIALFSVSFSAQLYNIILIVLVNLCMYVCYTCFR